MSKLEQKKQQKVALATNNINSGYSNFVYVFASTLNQMVNYIPWKKFGFQTCYALTVSNNKEFDNNKWNKNLEQVIGKNFESIEITQNEVLSIEDTKDKLLKHKEFPLDKSIFWNVTGGQRTFIFAVNEIVKDRPNDRICYLEGNTNKLIIMEPSMKAISEDYKLDDGMTIEIALKLMGFDVSSYGKGRTESFDNIKYHIDRSLYLKLIAEYSKNADLRKQLIITNKPANKIQAINEIENIIRNNNGFSQIEKDKISNILRDSQKTYPFGYMLEYIVAFTLLKVVENEIADMAVSTSLYFTNKEQQKSGGGSAIDEFDIAILTRAGQLLVFECKSGAMDGDVAKSTKYSVYAAAGVFGKPILITPFLKDEINNFKKTSISDDVFDEIKSAIRSAKRATLDVWGLDEIETKIKEKLK